jgi:hypothetical protein
VGTVKVLFWGRVGKELLLLLLLPTSCTRGVLLPVFFWAILCYSQKGNYRQEGLAKFCLQPKYES